MADYTLVLSDAEIARYRFMAEMAVRTERDLWVAAGAVPGARIADVGCGPGAVAVRLAEMAAPDGGVWAVDRDSEALAVARALAEQSGVRVETVAGSADATGLAAGTYDLVMLRHVLAHNGGSEQAIVDHLGTLTRPGGSVFLVDIDAASSRFRGVDEPAVEELRESYAQFHQRRGNDLSVGIRLDELLTAAGLDVVDFQGHIDIIKVPVGMRGPAWAARDSLVADGLATPDDLARWDEAFQRIEQKGQGITMFGVRYTAIARRR